MSDNLETPPSASVTAPIDPLSPPPAEKSSAKPHRGRWWKILAVVAAAIVLLILLAPTIAGTAPVRSYVLSRVNGRLNGAVSVEDWSIGWNSGLSVTGVRVHDANGIQVLQLSKLTTQLTLLDAVRGRYRLGDTVVDGLDALVKSDAQGVINFTTLSKKPAGESAPPLKTERQPPQESGSSKREPPSPNAEKPSRLPDISGDIKLINCSITYEDGRAPEIGGSGQTFKFPSIAGRFQIPSINEPIDNSLDVTCRVGDRPEGKLSTKGTLSVIANNVIDVDHASINQSATLRQIEAGAMTFLLGKDSSIRKLAGLTDADLAIHAEPNQDATVTAQLTSKNFAVGGPAFKGDTLTTKTLVVSAPGITIGRSANPTDVSKWTVKAGTEAQPLSIVIDQGKLTAFADASVGALQNFAAGLAPGSGGRIRSDANFDVGALAAQLRAMMAMKPGVELKSGKFAESMNIALTADRATIEKFNVDLTDVVAKQADGSDFAPKPIHIVLAASNFGGGWKSPDLRNLNLSLDSGFATATAKAGRLSDDLNAQLAADLKKFQNEWDPIVDFGDVSLSGTVTALANSQGDVAAGKDTKLNASVALANIGLSRIPATAASGVKSPANAILTDYSGEMKFDGAYKPTDPQGAQLNIGSLTYKDGGKLLDADASGTLLLNTPAGPQSRATTTLEMPQALKVVIKLPDLHALQNLSNGFSTAADAAKVARLNDHAANHFWATPDRLDPPLPMRFAAVGSVPVPTTKAAEPIAPPTVIDAGTATINFNVSREDARSVMTSQITTANLAIHKGEAKRVVGTIDVQTAMSFIPIPPPPAATLTDAAPGVIEQMRDLIISKLDINGGPAARIFIAEPIKIADPAGVSALLASLTDPAAVHPGAKPVTDLAAAIHATGNLGELMALMKILQADATPGRPYEGNYSFDQKVSAGAGGLAVVGGGNIDDLKNADGTFNEKRLHLANELTVDQSKQSVSIRNLLLDTEGTKALQLAMKGDVLDFSTQRRLQNFGGTLGYDWAKAWDLVRPMLAPETQKSLNLSIAGKGSKPFTLSGSYPAGKPFNEAVRTLAAQFGIAFDLLDVEGLKTEHLDLPLMLKDGHLHIAGAQGVPAAADCNGGKLALGGADIDLTAPIMRLTLPANHKFLENVGLNELLSDRLGDYINNPLFVDPKEAAGALSVNFVTCNRLALGSQKDPATHDATAQIVFSVSKLQLGNKVLQEIADELNQEDLLKSLKGEIKDSTITIKDGKTYQDITILTAEQKRPFRLTGDTDLATGRLHLTFLLPADFLGGKVEKFLPNGLPLALAGTTRGVQFDVAGQMQSLVQKNLVPGLLGSLAGGGKKSAGADDAGAKTAIPSNPQDLLDLFGKASKDPEKEKQKKERREKRRKEKEAAEGASPADGTPAK